MHTWKWVEVTWFVWCHKKPDAPYRILTCRDLEHMGLWNTKYCCHECHSDPHTMCMGVDEYYYDEQTVAVLCSASYWWFIGSRHDPLAKDTRDGVHAEPLHYLGKQPHLSLMVRESSTANGTISLDSRTPYR